MPNRLLAFTFAVAFIALSSQSNATEKLLIGSHIGNASILSISGINSDKATVLARREMDDVVETCAREIPPDQNGSVQSQKVANCSKTAFLKEKNKTYRRAAFCSRRTVYTEFGNFSLVSYEKEAESNYEGKPYRPMRTDWKDHRTEQIVGNCGGCNTPQILNTFEVLCPRLYKELFGGLDPY